MRLASFVNKLPEIRTCTNFKWWKVGWIKNGIKKRTKMSNMVFWAPILHLPFEIRTFGWPL